MLLFKFGLDIWICICSRRESANLIFLFLCHFSKSIQFLFFLLQIVDCLNFILTDFRFRSIYSWEIFIKQTSLTCFWLIWTVVKALNHCIIFHHFSTFASFFFYFLLITVGINFGFWSNKFWFECVFLR
jgi:hypothetical protein